MHDLTSLSAKALAELIKNKNVSCVEVMQAYLQRIKTVNPKINAIIEILPEHAIEQAQAADKMIAQHKTLAKLHGVPITIKQGRQVQGYLCNLGNQSPMNFIASEDATVVARLRHAGAIILGITNIPDFSMSYETDNLLYGCTHNPYDLNRSPGGSSGGEAASIAAGCSAFGIGADSGGSIRQPAHNCGIVGLKPTRGLIPVTGKFPDNALGIFSYIETQGPMARYVDDIIYALPIIMGPDGYDANTYPVNLRNTDQVKLKSLRIKFYTANGVATVTPEIDNAIRKIIVALTNQVASISEQYPIISKETYTEFEELFFYGGDGGQWLLDRMKKMQVVNVAPPFQAILNRAKQCEFSVTELRRRLLAVDQFKFTMMEYLRDADVIICPVATNTAGIYNGKRELQPQQSVPKLDLAYDLTYNLPYNIMGWPAVTVRCGSANDGLPIGLQVIAKSWREDIALTVAKAVEEISGGWELPKT